LPGQMVGERGGLGEELLEGGLVQLFVFLAGTEAGVEVFLKIRTEVDLFEWVFGRNRRLFDNPIAHGLTTADLIQRGNRLVDLLEDRVFDHLGVDHVGQFQLVQGQNTHHLHQTRCKDLALRYLQVQSGLQQWHDGLPLSV